jgi:hypothetical protein
MITKNELGRPFALMDYQREFLRIAFPFDDDDVKFPYIVADARKRGTPINKRYARLPMINEQYDAAMSQWQRINDELELDKGKTMEETRKEMLARQNAKQKEQQVAIVAGEKPPGIEAV